MAFEIIFNRRRSCNTINEFNEGIEFSVRLLSNPEEWIPLKYIYFRKGGNSHEEIYIGDEDNFTIRGYTVDIIQTYYPNVTNTTTYSKTIVMAKICFENHSDAIQFRWLQTSYLKLDSAKDNWILNFIEIEAVDDYSVTKMLLNESFENGEIK